MSIKNPLKSIGCEIKSKALDPAIKSRDDGVICKNSSFGCLVGTNLAESKKESKYPVQEIILDEKGVVGDVHRGPGNRQVSILGQESLDSFFARTGKKIKPGDFAENLTISGIDLTKIALLDRLVIGDAVLEITQLGKKCHGEVCAIFREVGMCAMPKEGVFARVIKGGKIKPGDKISYLARPLKILFLTLSDRAAAGIYKDTAGPLALKLTQEFFQGKRWHLEYASKLLSDDADKLTAVLEKALQDSIDIIFTIGGTGVGPRDQTPDVVARIFPKIIPGIMENIRQKHAETKPAALLSRSIAAVKNTTQIYTLPGSERAVSEYCPMIFANLEHIICMLHSLDQHGH
ncbi:MAG: molybdopterin-binding protein [Gammaproteobacteria bacterium]